MSMLSGQADKLRKEAQNMRDFGRYEMEQMLLDAADTILQLRDDLQRINAENTKLRELVKDIDEVADPFLWEFIGRRMRELGIEVE